MNLEKFLEVSSMVHKHSDFITDFNINPIDEMHGEDYKTVVRLSFYIETPTEEEKEDFNKLGFEIYESGFGNQWCFTLRLY